MMRPTQLEACKVYVIGGNYQVERMFHQFGALLTASIDGADIVCWTGGADVSPSYYREGKHPTTMCNARRDLYEKACFERAGDKIKVGICRGAQFLNVMNGGALWQDVDGHALGGTHPMKYSQPLGKHPDVDTKGGVIERVVNVTSTHHQMMIPNMKMREGHRQVEVWGSAGISTRKSTGVKDATGKFITAYPRSENGDRDAEILYYPFTRSLCFQPHPEYPGEHVTPTRELFMTCIDRVFLRLTA